MTQTAADVRPDGRDAGLYRVDGRKRSVDDIRDGELGEEPEDDARDDEHAIVPIPTPSPTSNAVRNTAPDCAA